MWLFKHIKIIFIVFPLQIIPEKDSKPVYHCTLHYFHGNLNFFQGCKAVPDTSAVPALRCHPCGVGQDEKEDMQSYSVTSWRQP